MIVKKIGLLISILLIAGCMVIKSGTQTSHPGKQDWSDPQSLNLYDGATGNFLDEDRDGIIRKATDSYQSQNYEDAVRYYLMALRLNIDDSNSIYNLACCYGLLEKDSLAAKYLARSVKAGFSNLNHLLNDPDFNSVRKTKVFTKTIAEISDQLKKQDSDSDEFHINGTVLHKCFVKLPENHEPNSKYTLVLGLHGYGGKPENFIRIFDGIEDREFIYAVIQAPYAFGAGNDLAYAWHTRENTEEGAIDLSANYIADAAKRLSKQYNVEDIYLLGFSQGAFYSITAGIKYHELIKGIIPIGGWINEDVSSAEAIEAANDLRVLLLHGKKDQAIEYDEALKSKDIFEKYQYDVKLVDFEEGHRITKEIVEHAADWIMG